VSTLLILAVVTLIVIHLTQRQRIDIRRTTKLLYSTQASAYVSRSEIWANALLNSSFYESEWPQKMPLMTFPEGNMEAYLYDAQSQFYNINNLSITDNHAGFEHLLKILLPSQNPQTIQQLTKAIINYGLFVSPSELRLMKDVTLKNYRAMIPVMISLPEVTKININAASALILTTLGNGLSPEEAKAILDKRAELGGFKKMGDFFAIPQTQNHKISSREISLDSQYFLLKTIIHVNTQTMTFFTLLKKSSTPPAPTTIERLWQTRETL